MTLDISKSLLRKVTLDYRRLLDSDSFKCRNEKLCEKVLDLVRLERVKTIHVFLPIKRNNEPDITHIFEELRSLGVKIVTSKTNFKQKTLSHWSLERDTHLVLSSMGIYEPKNAIEVDFSEVDLVLVPLTAADKQGNRIGYGGGFYDQLLENSAVTKVGLALAPLLDHLLQTEEWDVVLDQILTPDDSFSR